MGDVRPEGNYPDRTFVGFELPRSGEGRTKVLYDGLATPEAVCAGHKVHGIRLPRRRARKYSVDHPDVVGGFARGLAQEESANFLDVRDTDGSGVLVVGRRFSRSSFGLMETAMADEQTAAGAASELVDVDDRLRRTPAAPPGAGCGRCRRLMSRCAYLPENFFA